MRFGGQAGRSRNGNQRPRGWEPHRGIQLRHGVADAGLHLLRPHPRNAPSGRRPHRPRLRPSCSRALPWRRTERPATRIPRTDSARQNTSRSSASTTVWPTVCAPGVLLAPVFSIASAICARSSSSSVGSLATATPSMTTASTTGAAIDPIALNHAKVRTLREALEHRLAPQQEAEHDRAPTSA